jgi:hypothetical protein
MSIKADREMGQKNEHATLPILSAFFKTDLKKEENKYSINDFMNEAKTISIELKSRRIPHNKFPTSIIGYNKIKYCTNPDIKYYFAWVYSDGIYYIKYDKDEFSKYRIQKDFQRGFRYDVNKIEFSSVVHIPYEKLQKIPNLEIK